MKKILPLTLAASAVGYSAGDCSCTLPSSVTLNASNFSNSCNFEVGNGIQDKHCYFRQSTGTLKGNSYPDSVNKIIVMGLYKNLTKSDVFECENCDTITAHFPTEDFGGIQISAQGMNNKGETVTQDSIASFAECNKPLLAGDVLGWLNVVSRSNGTQTSPHLLSSLYLCCVFTA